MKPQYQLITGRGGDCLRACIASILEVPTDALPHFSSTEYPDQLDRWNSFLAPANLKLEIPDFRPIGYHIAGVEQNGVLHACVAQNGGVVHDPYPGNEPPYDGYIIAVRIALREINTDLPRDLDKIGVSLPAKGAK